MKKSLLSLLLTVATVMTSFTIPTATVFADEAVEQIVEEEIVSDETAVVSVEDEAIAEKNVATTTFTEGQEDLTNEDVIAESATNGTDETANDGNSNLETVEEGIVKDNVEVVKDTSNVIKSWDFATGIDDWTVSDGTKATIEYDSTSGVSGTGCLKITSKVDWGDWGSSAVVYGYVGSMAAGNYKITLDGYSANGAYPVFAFYDDSTWKQDSGKVGWGSSYSEQTLTFTLADAITNGCIRIIVNAPNNDCLYIDNVTVESTDPVPEDIRNVDFYIYSENDNLTGYYLLTGGSFFSAPQFVATEYENWYKTTIKMTNAVAGEAGSGFNICKTSDWGDCKAMFYHQAGWSENESVYDALIALEDGDSIYVTSATDDTESKDYKAYASIEDAMSITVDKLKTKLAEVKAKYVEDASVKKYYTEESLAKLASVVDNAKAYVTDAEAAIEGGASESDYFATNEEQYKALDAAILALEAKVKSEINVVPVELPASFMTGGDISSFYALSQAGTVFKDENGKALSDKEFFKYLKDGGMDWARIRIWNDPYDTSGNGYGGGNNDLAKAIAMGKLATDAGMKVLIDFHYSDFWADPSKYKAPKAWSDFNNQQKADALYDFTKDSIYKLLQAGVDVGMVQVGNESNHGLAGETDGNATKLYGYGVEAVHDATNAYYGKTIAKGESGYIKTAIHLTDVQNGGGTVTSGLDNQVRSKKYTHRDGSEDYVQYDAVGVSYYPMYRHGTIENLEAVMSKIATEYGPGGGATEVFVAETSWATSWGDGDGFSNSGPSLKGQDIEEYSISVQGQADELRAVVNAVNNVGGTGVFYWEPAWIAPYVACYDDYTWNDEYYAKNKEAWEKYGIGWASSYSYEYDPTDAGLYYGGIGVDNMSWFDFDGTALPTAKIYSLIRTGASSTVKDKLVGIQKNQQISIQIGEEVAYPDAVKGYLNNYYSTKETVDVPVKWNSADKAKVDVDKTGYYTVNGTATYDGSKYAVMLTIQVSADNNVYLKNGDFEDADSSVAKNKVKFPYWDVRFKMSDTSYVDQSSSYAGFSIEKSNPRTDKGALNFWKQDAGLNITATQKMGTIGKGQYTFGGYFEGGSAGEFDKQYAVAYVYESEAKYLEDYNNNKALGTSALRKYRDDGQFGGWLNWQNVEIPRIEVSNNTEYLVVGFEFNGTPSGAWGSVDDAYLFGNYSVSVKDAKGGEVKVSNYSPSINAKVSISAKPDKGMAVSTIKVVGAADLDAKYFSGWTIDPANPKVAVFNNIDKTAAIAKANFRMPASNVTVEVEFVDPLASGTPKLTLDNVVSVGGLTTKPYAFVATGKALTPAVVLNYNGYTLTKSDFKAAYNNNVSAGEASISITGKGKFAGANLDIPFTIKDAAGKDISKDFTIEMAEFDAKNAYYYTGEAIEPLKAIKASNGAALNKGTDYTVTYTKNIKVGTATMYAVGVGEYTGSVKKTFKIAKADIEVLIKKGLLKVNGRTGDTVAESALSNGTYIDGKKGVEPGVTVRYGASMLKQKKDYKVSYKNNKKITEEGEFATAVIKGSGNFTGSYTLKFKVEPRSIADTAAVRVVIDDMVDNGKDITPKTTVYAKSLENKEKTIKKENYFISCIKNQATGEVIYNDGKSVSGNKVDGKPTVKGEGIYTVYVAGQKNLKDYVEVTDVRVRNKDYVLKASNVKFGKIYYTGHEIKVGKPLTIDTEKTGALSENSIRVVAGNGTVLDEKSFMITEYKNNRKSGTAQIRVKGIGDYAGNFVTTFKIDKLKLVDEEAYKKLVTDGKALGYATTSLKDMEQTSDTTYKYMHYYNGYKQTPEYAVKVTTINDKFKINPNKDYQMVYKNNDKPNDFDGDGLCDSDKKPIIATIKGVGNYTGSIKIEMKNTGYKNSDAKEFAMTKRTIKDFSIQIDTATVEGKLAKPVPTFFDEYGVAVYINPKVYSVKYINNKEVAGDSGDEAPTVEITAKGDFAAGLTAEESKVVKTFSIASAVITKADIAEIAPQSFKNGQAVQPTVKVTVNGKTLKLNKDYIVVYKNNCMRYAVSEEDEDVSKAPTATVIGIGNYTGEASVVFTIK